MPLVEKINYYLDEIELRRQYRKITRKLPKLLRHPRSSHSLDKVNNLQAGLFSFSEMNMEHPDFFTAERTEKIWDLLHEARHYLSGSAFQRLANERCLRFSNYFVDGERSRPLFIEVKKFLEELCQIAKISY